MLVILKYVLAFWSVVDINQCVLRDHTSPKIDQYTKNVLYWFSVKQNPLI
jgi:hypothetical protein